MAESNILVRLKLLNDSFDRSIAQSKKQMDIFKNASASVGKVLGGLGLGFAGAEVASQSFKRTLYATQSSGDELNASIAGVQSGVEHFFQTLANGDWSNFLQGMHDAIRTGREYATLLDELGDRVMSFGIEDQEARIQLLESKKIVNDTTGRYTKEEKKKASDDVNRLNKSLSDTAQKNSNKAFETALKAFQSMSNNTSATMDDLKKYIVENQGHKNEKYEAVAAEYAKLKKQENLYKGSTDPQQQILYLNAKKKREHYEKMFPKAVEEYKHSSNVKDDERQKIFDAYKQGLSFLERSLTQEVGAVRLNNRAGGVSGGGSRKASKDLDKLSELNKKIKDLEAQIAEAPEGARKALREKIAELEGERFELTVALKYDKSDLTQPLAAQPLKVDVKPVFARAQEQIRAFRKENDELYIKLRTTIDTEERKKIKSQINNNVASINDLTEDFGIKMPDLPKPFENYEGNLESVFSANASLIDSFGAVAQSISAISGSSDNAFASTTRWLAGTMNAIGQAIPVITSLTAAKNAQASAEAKEAAAGAGSAVASIPVVGPIMAVSAIASIVAALAAIPKFEHGGIVGGNSYHGDRIWARLNSGELVLNKAQQRILDNRLSQNGGGGQVEFKIRGQELVGVLSKYNRSNSRS